MYNIRVANEEDYEDLGQVLFSSHRPYFQPGVSIEKRRKDLTNVVEIAKTAVILVAVHNDQIIGTGAVELSSQVKYPEFPQGSAYVRAIAVDSRYRRGGIGRAILTKIKEIAIGAGKSSLVLRTSENMVEAQNMYENFGFVRVESMDWVYPNTGFRLLTYIDQL